MGGAMDLAVGVKELIVAMEHCTKTGAPRILKECTFPLTGCKCVKYVVTELCTLQFTPEGIELVELADGSKVEEIIRLTEAPIMLGKFG